jgi:tRNA-(ms[2]io[6]A)-hydroxylase
MLCLNCDTNPEWIEAVKKDLNITIADHAHCEKKAALTGMSLLNKYPDKTELAFALSDLVEEEIGHFRAVMKILKSRDVVLTPDRSDEYAKSLFKKLRKNQPERFMDHLLVAGIIEARSCERLQILEKNLEDETLSKFYKTLAASEAGHYMMFVKMAELYFDREDVKTRLDELVEYEAKLVKSLPNNPTMHG